MNLFQYILDSNEEKNSKRVGGVSHRIQSRKLRMEQLENRELLAVTAAEFAEIRATYPDMNLTANMTDYNVIELTSAELSLEKLQAAITNAGTTAKPDVIVCRTTDTQNTITSSAVTININGQAFGGVTIVGFGDKPLTLDGDQQYRVMGITGCSVGLANLTITNGKVDGDGGGILFGGGVDVELILTHCTVTGNTASQSGGGIISFNTLKVSNSTISNNQVYAEPEVADSSGGGIANFGVATITNCDVIDNYAYRQNFRFGGGGGLYNAKTLTVLNSTLSGNSSIDSGGGIYNNDGTLVVENCEIAGNSTDNQGGAIYSKSGVVQISDTIITANTAARNGGGVANDESECEFVDCSITLNSAISGGGIYNESGKITLTKNVVEKNIASNYGGGVYNYRGNLTVDESSISDNSASNGGGIYNSLNTAVVTKSTISGNAGNGIYSDDSIITFIDTVISANASQNNGGGIYSYNSKVTVTNCLVSGNSAAIGGGIDNSILSSLVITGSTIAGNFASVGAGGILNNGSTKLYNSIVAKNSTEIHITSGTVYATNSLIGDGTDSSLENGVNGNIVGSSASHIDPEFVKIPAIIDETTTGKNYTSKNWDLHLHNTSRAIDKGDNSRVKYPDETDIVFDIGGKPRIFNQIVDIGAYEFQTQDTTTPGDSLDASEKMDFDENGFYTITDQIGNGLYGKKDVDMFNFTVTQADVDAKLVYTFNTSKPTSETAVSVDTYLKLFDSTGKIIAFNDDISTANRYSEIVWSPTVSDVGKTFYVGISSYQNRNYNPEKDNSGLGGTTGDYKLDITKKVLATEPGDQISKAEKVTLTGTTPYTITDKIGNGLYGKKDVDMFELTVTAADIASHNTYTFLTDTVEDGVNVDTYLKLFDSTGKLITYNDDISANNRYSKIEWTPTVSGTYYVGISSYGNRNYNPNAENSGPGGATGDYKLTVSRSNVGAEPGDTLNTAWEIDFGTNDSFTIHDRIGNGVNGNRDVDMFRFEVSAADVGRLFTFTTSRPGTEVALFDTYLRLFDSNGTELVFNDDFGSTRYSQIEWEAETAGVYYIGVSSYGNRRCNPQVAASGPGGATGEYDLAVLRGEVLDSLFA
ncbi:MAG: DVUA0089 family protein [Thermoguttaceae bacterium]